ncbi:hypothetical protein [Lentzea flava]|uniref:Uncharacterized protein n=1 Tax=Lentzea flava TaxID=103732 RepID=A0ABQ2UEM9_9PSEU|nr:hypothetical protein [Lentzea flava]MCP2197509.1 hypothetical protein [Lentzea flava]GGU20207.1 hypothetical protein GCM10010178_10350 [Lentzea flava]
MTETNSTRPSGAGRSWLRWGCLILLALVAGAIVLITVTIVRFLHRADPDRQMTIQVESIRNNLLAHAEDGVLTDEEIMRVTSRDSDGDPQARRGQKNVSFDTAVNVVTSSLFGSSGKTECYTFTITVPLSRSSTVTATKLPSCESLVRAN